MLEARTRKCWDQGMNDVAITKYLEKYYDTERYGLRCGTFSAVGMHRSDLI